MLSTIRKTIAREKLCPAGSRVLVAVSGGPDSLALLVALVELAPALGLELEAATVDHGLRPESAGEAQAVVRRCRELRIPCRVLKVDVGAARGRGVSLQDAARRVRLGALALAASERRCPLVALGHTADDQAETVLFRIVRGTGVRGLAGIPYARPPFVRPLLDVRRKEILRFLARRRLSFAEDPSNQDRRFTRSRVRHDWLPYLAKENPRLVEALLDLGREARALSAGAEPVAPTATGDGLAGVARRPAARIAEIAGEGRGTRWVHFQGGVAEIAYGTIQLQAPGARRVAGRDRRSIPVPELRLEVPAPGQYRWLGGAASGGASLEIKLATGRIRQPDRRPARAGDPATFDCDCLDQGLFLRAPLPGDRMRPRGGRGSRKLSDLLIDAKVPRARRAELPVLCTRGGTILFVPGLRPSEVGRPGATADRWIEIRSLPGQSDLLQAHQVPEAG